VHRACPVSDTHQAIDVGLGRVPAHLRVQIIGEFTEFAHLTQHRPTTATHRGNRRHGGLHRFRVGVIGVVHHRDSAHSCHDFHAHGAPRTSTVETADRSLQCHPAFDPDRNRGKRVRHVVPTHVVDLKSGGRSCSLINHIEQEGSLGGPDVIATDICRGG
jgi:hypothetical protein